MSLFRRRFRGAEDEEDPRATQPDSFRRDALARELRQARAKQARTAQSRTQVTAPPGPPSDGGALVLLRKVAFGLRPAAEALRLRAATADLAKLAELEQLDSEAPSARLLRILEACGQTAARVREGADLMKECLAGVLDALGRLEAGERETRDGIVTLRDRLTRTEDVEDLEELRGLLLDHATALIEAAADRQEAIVEVRKSAQESHRRARELEAALQDAAAEARIDPLTRLPNRRALDESVARRASTGAEVGVLAIDLDHFKQINDQHGHAAGDEVLRTVAGLLAAELRGDDEAFRVGGEELVVLLAESGWQGARATAERLRKRLARRAIPVASGASVRVTMSVGVALWTPPTPFAEAQHTADQALYRAKQSGRDRVVG